MVCYNLHLNTNPILEIELKLFTKWNSVHGVIIYMYQLADLGLARVSVQIVFLSAKRRSIQKASSPLLPENPLGIWTFKDWLIQIPVSRGQNCGFRINCPPHPDKVQVPHLLERTTVKCPSVDVEGGGGVCWSLGLIGALSWDRHCLILWFSLSSRCVLVSDDSPLKKASWHH